MKGRVIAFERGAAALMVDGRLEDFMVAGPDGAHNPGDVFVARLDRKTGKNAGFCTIGKGQQGYLREARDLAPGDAVLAQLVSLPETGKAPSLSPNVLHKGRFVILTPGRPGVNLSRKIKDEQARAHLLDFVSDWGDETCGVIIREAAMGASPEALGEDYEDALARNAACATALATGETGICEQADMETLAARAWAWPAADVTGQSFEEAGVWDALEALKSPVVPLGGGSIIVEPTRALTAVDVNTGGDFSPASALKANLAAAKALPRQLRMRGLGGQIAVDFAPMPQKQRADVEVALKRALVADGIETSLVGWTKMGLFELERKRERHPTAAFLSQI